MFQRASEPRLRPDADLVHMREWASKLAGAVSRIAGLLHFSYNVSEAYKHSIGENTMTSALSVGGYLIEHALAAFVYMGVEEASGDAREVLAWSSGRA